MCVLAVTFLLSQAREGDWYPTGLSFSDMRGLAGYKIFLSVALLLGEGGFIMVKAALLGRRDPICSIWFCSHMHAAFFRIRRCFEWGLNQGSIRMVLEDCCLATRQRGVEAGGASLALLG